MKCDMAENEIDNGNEHDIGDESDKVNNTTAFTTVSGPFEQTDASGTLPSRVWRRILPSVERLALL